MDARTLEYSNRYIQAGLPLFVAWAEDPTNPERRNDFENFCREYERENPPPWGRSPTPRIQFPSLQ
jgi:hypothetical protein